MTCGVDFGGDVVAIPSCPRLCPCCGGDVVPFPPCHHPCLCCGGDVVPFPPCHHPCLCCGGDVVPIPSCHHPCLCCGGDDVPFPSCCGDDDASHLHPCRHHRFHHRFSCGDHHHIRTLYKVSSGGGSRLVYKSLVPSRYPLLCSRYSPT